MQKKLFLCAPADSGPRELIKRVLGGKLAEAGGFITKPSLNTDGALLGLELFPAAAAADVEGFSGARFLDLTSSPPKTDNEVFRVEAVRLLQEAPYYPFSVLDEIGGFELVIPQFRQALAAFLSSPVPCIGIIRPLEEAELLRSYLGLGERYIEFANRLRSSLDADSDVLILDCEHFTPAQIEASVRQWAEEYAR